MAEEKIELDEETLKKMDALEQKVTGYFREPWTLMIEPFKVTDNIYYVGNRYVASYLIDTGDGLVIIDCGFRETLYQLVDSIYKVGYKPQDIKYIFLSHGHIDHCGATRQLYEMCKAPVYIGEGDLFFFTERRDLIIHEEMVADFPITGTYDYDKPWTIGNTTFHFVHTPGHTPGCTTFLIDTTHHGEPVVAAMHGGLGLNGLTYAELAYNDLPSSLHEAFYDQLKMCRDFKVDIVIPSHNHDYDILSLAEKDDGSGDIFVNPTGWRDLMDSKINAYLPLL